MSVLWAVPGQSAPPTRQAMAPAGPAQCSGSPGQGVDSTTEGSSAVSTIVAVPVSGVVGDVVPVGLGSVVDLLGSSVVDDPAEVLLSRATSAAGPLPGPEGELHASTQSRPPTTHTPHPGTP